MSGSWLDKNQYWCVSVCILFFRDRTCHVSSTERSAAKHLPPLIRAFNRQGFETLATEVVSVSHVDHWDRVHDKYMWRYLMHVAGFRIVNQDGTYFEDVDGETWDGPKLGALKHYEFLSLRPALSLVTAQCKKRRSPFLPRQAVQRLLREACQTLHYSHIESTILGLTVVPEEWFGRVHFRKGRVLYETTIKLDRCGNVGADALSQSADVDPIAAFY